jgi:hypothetical protein
MVTEKNCIHKEVYSILNSGNACCHSVYNLLFSNVLSRNINIKINKTIMLPVVLHRCETWSIIKGRIQVKGLWEHDAKR